MDIIEIILKFFYNKKKGRGVKSLSTKYIRIIIWEYNRIDGYILLLNYVNIKTRKLAVM